jgi:hypothetical protein
VSDFLTDKVELLLGDNPLFGIDHLSQERARKRMERVDGLDKVVEIMEFVSSLGVKGFVVSTHPNLKHLINILDENTNLLKKFDFYPILPYAQGYVTKVTDEGIMNVLRDVLSTGSKQDRLKLLWKGASGFLRKDFEKLFQTFIDLELLPLTKTRKKIIFLHDVVTDVAISLGMNKIIENFVNHIETQYGVQAGLVTKNFPLLVKTLEEWEIKIPTVMTSFNPIGYQMNPSKEDCEKCVSKTEVIPMNMLAGGYLKPEESFQYLSKLGVKSIVVGMSSKEHAQETINALKKSIH